MKGQYLPIGTRVRLTRDVERYPHFIAKRASTGRRTDMPKEITLNTRLRVRPGEEG